MLKTGAILLSLMLLSACATNQDSLLVQPGPAVVVPVIETRYAPVDPSLLRLYEAVPDDFKTNGELLEAFYLANKRLSQCSYDKAELATLLNQ